MSLSIFPAYGQHYSIIVPLPCFTAGFVLASVEHHLEFAKHGV